MMKCKIPPARPGVHHRSSYQSDMPKLPLNLYSELPLDVWAPHSIFESESSPPRRKLISGQQQLTPNPEGAIHHSLAENHGPQLGGAETHSGRFTLSCRPHRGRSFRDER